MRVPSMLMSGIVCWGFSVWMLSVMMLSCPFSVAVLTTFMEGVFVVVGLMLSVEFVFIRSVFLMSSCAFVVMLIIACEGAY